MRDEVGTGDVEIGEVSAVGLVQVVVRFEEGGVGLSDAVVEEGSRREDGGFTTKADVVEEGVEDTNLSRRLSLVRVR